jgi:hypothetical protein
MWSIGQANIALSPKHLPRLAFRKKKKKSTETSVFKMLSLSEKEQIQLDADKVCCRLCTVSCIN